METVQQVVDLAVMFAQQNPKASAAVGGLSALYVGVQALGLAFARIFPSHTIAARLGAKVAAFPLRLGAVR